MMSWRSAWLRSVGIVSFFVVFTVWLPSWLLGLDPVASANAAVRDAVAVLSWFVGLAVGIVALRLGQRRGWL